MAGEKKMVYCTKCGTKNEEDAEMCSSCGAHLRMSRRIDRGRSGSDCFGSRNRREDECFGLPHGGAIIGIIFGAIIILVGLALLYDWSVLWSYFWPFIVIIFGILIISGALYGMMRRK
ncbi:MAG: zinc ribbon domain-containing protein [Candidatus Bathyarchaeota archaeon]|nr:zinc ribbon domain-containing protein [Candidatus Bathyarchaeota archaeon]